MFGNVRAVEYVLLVLCNLYLLVVYHISVDREYIGACTCTSRTSPLNLDACRVYRVLIIVTEFINLKGCNERIGPKNVLGN